jgi:molybdate transport system permease protein
MKEEFWQTLLITFQLAAITTVFLLIIGIPLAYYLARSKSKIKPIIETFISMPLVLPPTVLGFYLLIGLSPESLLGAWLDSTFNLRLVFSFTGLVLGSIIYSLPFMVHPIQSGFENLPISYSEASYTLGKSRLETLFRVLLPNMKPSLLTGIVLSFAHTVGEFGVVLMIGGNIPGQTKVASIAIYDEVEGLNYAVANQYALILFIFSFVVLMLVYGINRRGIRANEF